MARLNRYEQVIDPATSLVLEIREWFDPNTDSLKQTIECNYGFGLGEVAALKRIVSA